ncbi:hypothetical protein AVEN_80520-1 [Araneus ventricosus]|uniref:Tesmin/TSO1-like CXC domain-containing protein n=1 Tax=Araneus ventricosus TaxID=182803 RepID=A0A4Y2QRW0_ARAVE|nr:hypothetical protein AVEN_164977-1 [Araneus ventricosus]GBN66097.1 hypothetical protein AVEN_80520-1 [Araneus ventricosus]
MSKQAQPDRLVDAGQRLLVALYGGKDDDTLNGLIFQLFTKSLVKENFNLASLPPTLEALRKHCVSTYLRIQMWLGQVMNPLKWGWQNTKHGLHLITTIKTSATLLLLMPTFCKCAKGCRSSCYCRKSRIKCSAKFAICKGCFNAPPETDEQILQLSEDIKDPDDAEETGNALTLPLNGRVSFNYKHLLSYLIKLFILFTFSFFYFHQRSQAFVGPSKARTGSLL